MHKRLIAGGSVPELQVRSLPERSLLGDNRERAIYFSHIVIQVKKQKVQIICSNARFDKIYGGHKVPIKYTSNMKWCHTVFDIRDKNMQLDAGSESTLRVVL